MEFLNWIDKQLDKWRQDRDKKHQCKSCIKYERLIDNLLDELNTSRFERDKLISKIIEKQEIKLEVAGEEPDLVEMPTKNSRRRSIAELTRQAFKQENDNRVKKLEEEFATKHVDG